MPNRDDFYKLDEFSFGQCCNILEEYEDARFKVNATLSAINPDGISVKTLDALDKLLEHVGNTRKTKLFRSIFAQIKKEEFPDEETQ